MSEDSNSSTDEGLARAEKIAALDSAESRSDREADNSPGETNEAAESETEAALIGPQLESALEDLEEQVEVVKNSFESSQLINLHTIADLMSEGLTAQEALDYLAVNRYNYGQAEWGRITGGRMRQTVHKTVKRAEAKLR